MHMPIPC
jgi:hypothetical protein